MKRMTKMTSEKMERMVKTMKTGNTEVTMMMEQRMESTTIKMITEQPEGMKAKGLRRAQTKSSCNLKVREEQARAWAL